MATSTFRDAEKLDFKLKKTKDINFLQNCIDNNSTPAFVSFRLYNRGLQSSRMYRNFQKQLLENEQKQTQERTVSKTLNTRLTGLRNLVSVCDFAHLSQLISTSNDKKIVNVNRTQDRKLFKFGLRTSDAEHKLVPKSNI